MVVGYCVVGNCVYDGLVRSGEYRPEYCGAWKVLFAVAKMSGFFSMVAGTGAGKSVAIFLAGSSVVTLPSSPMIAYVGFFISFIL